MADTQPGLAADYLVEGYVEADEQLRRHEHTGSETALRHAAAALCKAFAQLEDDDAFWETLKSIRSSVASEVARPALDDVDALIGLERKVLSKAGVPEVTAASIVQAVAREIEMVDHWPDEWSVNRMRETVGSAGRAACVRASMVHPGKPSALRRAIGVGAGAVVIATNGIAAPPGAREISVFVGGRMILRFARGPDA